VSPLSHRDRRPCFLDSIIGLTTKGVSPSVFERGHNFICRQTNISLTWVAEARRAEGDSGDEVLGDVAASPHFFFVLRCRVVVDNVGDHVMPEQSVFCRPDGLGWAYVILKHVHRLSKY